MHIEEPERHWRETSLLLEVVERELAAVLAAWETESVRLVAALEEHLDGLEKSARDPREFAPVAEEEVAALSGEWGRCSRAWPSVGRGAAPAGRKGQRRLNPGRLAQKVAVLPDRGDAS